MVKVYREKKPSGLEISVKVTFPEGEVPRPSFNEERFPLRQALMALTYYCNLKESLSPKHPLAVELREIVHEWIELAHQLKNQDTFANHFLRKVSKTDVDPFDLDRW
ncbi:MAG: hypothetical protein GXN92_00265 [Candidatus Micrarchaeota archaeon]|nr:hypothetical protein [Candidatus Micrarchaeota archaeon]